MNSKEIQELQELYSEVYIVEEKSGSPKPTFIPKSRERNIGKHDDWKDKPSTEWGEKSPAAKKLTSRLTAVVGTQRRQDKETGVREEVEQVDEKINLTTQSSKRKSLGKDKGEYESPKQFRKTEIKDAPYQSKGNYNAHLPEEVELFDVVLEFLCVEGYAETLEEAEWIMANELDVEDIGAILNERKYDRDEKLPGSGKTPREKMERQRGKHGANYLLRGRETKDRNDQQRTSHFNRATTMDTVKAAQDAGEEPSKDPKWKNTIAARRRPRASYEVPNDRPGGLRAGDTKAGGHRTLKRKED